MEAARLEKYRKEWQDHLAKFDPKKYVTEKQRIAVASGALAQEKLNKGGLTDAEKSAAQRKVKLASLSAEQIEAYSEYKRQARNLKKQYESLTNGLVKAPRELTPEEKAKAKEYRRTHPRSKTTKSVGGISKSKLTGVPIVANPRQKKK